MKLQLSIVVLVATLLAICSAQSNNAQWGQLQSDSVLSYSNLVERGSQVMQSVEERFTYPPKGVINAMPIHAIRAYDQKNNGNGATATIVAGGLGQPTVTVLFKSQRGHGINFILQVLTAQCK